MVNSFIQAILASKQKVLLVVGLGSIFLLGVGYFLEYVVGLIPCALCIIQRGFFLGVGLTALLGAWHNRFTDRYASLMFVFSLLGGAVAVRNVYIQLVPQELGAKCIPWLESFTDMVTVLFQATGDCSKRDWTLIGLSIPEWSLISFIILTLISGWLLWKKETVAEEN